MAYFDETRSLLIARRAELHRRIDEIESDLERHGAAVPTGADPRNPATTALFEFMDTLQREVGLLDSAILRIDSREYDCCIRCGGTIRADRLEMLPYAVNCASCSRDFPREYVEQLRAQHSSLRRALISVLELLADMIQKCETDKISDVGLAPTLALIADVGRQLPEHFAHEEKDGFLDDALSTAPRYSRRAQQLMKDHAVFSQQIFTIVKNADTAGSSSVAWRAVRESFKQLTLDLLAHEQAENDIIEGAFLDDLGSGH